MYLPSMPAIARDLHLTPDQIQSTLTLWFLGASTLQFALGPISDRYGRKNVLVIGGIIFVISSIGCALADNLQVMLLARFAQGLSVCSLVAAYAAVHELYSAKRAIKLLALIGAVTILAPAFGPLVGALIVQFTSWRYIFWLLASMGAIGFISLWAFMPESINERHPLKITTIARDYKKILTNKNFMLLNISYCLLVGIFFVWMFEAPFIIIELHNHTPLFYGISQSLIFGCFLIGAAITKWFLTRYSVLKLIQLSTIVTIFGTICLLYTSKMYGSIIVATASMMVVSVGSSMLFGPINRIAIESSTQPMGRRTAVFSTTISLFGALTGWILALINNRTLMTVSVLIIVCMALATFLLIFAKIPEFADEED